MPIAALPLSRLRVDLPQPVSGARLSPPGGIRREARSRLTSLSASMAQKATVEATSTMARSPRSRGWRSRAVWTGGQRGGRAAPQGCPAPSSPGTGCCQGRGGTPTRAPSARPGHCPAGAEPGRSGPRGRRRRRCWSPRPPLAWRQGPTGPAAAGSAARRDAPWQPSPAARPQLPTPATCGPPRSLTSWMSRPRPSPAGPRKASHPSEDPGRPSPLPRGRDPPAGRGTARGGNDLTVQPDGRPRTGSAEAVG